MPKATVVTIEPYSEDDWEVLELNAELAEAIILNQVLIFIPIFYNSLSYHTSKMDRKLLDLVRI